MKMVHALNSYFHNLMKKNDKVYFIGQDIMDPYGGAFKVSKGLSLKFPNRVIATPISESGIVGLGSGLAIKGKLPIVEIMFGDFLSLTFDQILNSASKFQFMYNEQVKVPLTIRTPMGGGRGYGPTHSQSIESYFMGIPGFDVYAIDIFNDIDQVLDNIITKTLNPKLIIEHKLSYPENILTNEVLEKNNFIVETLNEKLFPTKLLSFTDKKNCELTILAYGHTASIASKIIKELMFDYEISCQLVIPSKLYPFSYDHLLYSLENSNKLLILEEGTFDYGFGSEISAHIAENFSNILASPTKRLASDVSIIPSSKNQEFEMLINEDKIKKEIISIAKNN